MVFAHPENQELIRALLERDADAAGPALLKARLVLAATPGANGDFEGEAARAEDGTLELAAFTSEGNLRASGPEAPETIWMRGSEVITLALRIGVGRLRLDPGQDHGGYFGREALVALWRRSGSVDAPPIDAPGDWATPEIAEAVRGVVREQPELAGAWLADRTSRPSVVLDTQVEDPTAIIQALVAALKPIVSKMTIDFVLLDEGHREQAEALGEPLR